MTDEKRGWQPIETCPKGKDVWFFSEQYRLNGHRVWMGRRTKKDNWLDSKGVQTFEPCRWMKIALPEEPEITRPVVGGPGPGGFQRKLQRLTEQLEDAQRENAKLSTQLLSGIYRKNETYQNIYEAFSRLIAMAAEDGIRRSVGIHAPSGPRGG